jgi:hypothetical protein
MKALRISNLGRTTKWARVALVGAALVAAASPALGDLLGSGTTTLTAAVPSAPTGCWKFTIVADAAAKLAGRDNFFEYVYFEGTTFDGQEMARLGFDPGPVTGGINALGQTTFSVTIKSASSGTVVASGLYLTTTMTGTLVWTKPDGKVYNYTFTAAPYTPDPNVES